MSTKAKPHKVFQAARPRRRSRAGFTVPLAVLAGFAPLVSWGIVDMKAGGVKQLSGGLCARLTGYNPGDGKWNSYWLMQGAAPIVLGILAHKLAGKLGVNRALGRSGIPFVRI